MGKFMTELGNLGPGAAISAGSDLIGTAMGMALAGWQDRRQLKQQQKLTEMQVNAQKGMIDYQNQATFDMWQKTGPTGQVAQLKEAGLNPALMYGMGGGTGGQSVSQSANVGAGQTSQQSMAMGLSNMAQTAAQVKLMDAQARNLDANTEKTAGPDTDVANMTIEQMKQTIKNQQAQQALTETQNEIQQIERDLKQNTFNDVINQIYWNGKSAAQQYEILVRTNAIGDATKQDVIRTVRAELVKLGLESAMLKQGIDESKSKVLLNAAMEKYYLASRQQGWDSLTLGNRNAANAEQARQQQQFIADMQTATGLPADVIETVLKAAGGKR